MPEPFVIGKSRYLRSMAVLQEFLESRRARIEEEQFALMEWRVGSSQRSSWASASAARAGAASTGSRRVYNEAPHLSIC